LREQQLQTANADLLAFGRSVAALAHRAATFFSAPMEATFRDAEIQLQVLLRERRSYKAEVLALQSQHGVLQASIDHLTAQLNAKDAEAREEQRAEVVAPSCAAPAVDTSSLDYDDGEIAFTRRGPQCLRDCLAETANADQSPGSDCRRSSLTSSSPQSIQSLTSLDLQPESKEPAEGVADGKRQRRLVLPRGWSSHALQAEKFEHNLPTAGMPTLARQFVDPFFKLPKPQHDLGDQATTASVDDIAYNAAPPGPSLQELSSNEITSSGPDSVSEMPMAMTENIPMPLDAPTKSAKKSVKKRNVLRALIQTVSTN
jgi:hypothetical protein